MSEPSTVNIALIIPNTGDLPGTWGSAALNPDFNAIDGFTGGVQTISASNANIVLTAPAGTITPSAGPTQAQNAVLRFTGALTGNVQVTLPLPGYMIIENLTTGAFVLTFAAASAGQVIGIEQGVTQRIYNDGTNVKFVNLQTVGSYLDVCDATVPAWITACTVPPFLNCDGTTFNATTYPYLNTKLGGNTLPDIRGGSRATLNQGTSRITTAGSGINGDVRFSRGGAEIVTLTTIQIPSHSHGVNDPGHIHGIPLVANVGNQPFPAASSSNSAGTAETNIAETGISIQNTGGGGAHNNMGPTTISGITLIRAA